MPPLSGFTDNGFQTRSDLLRAAEALLKPLRKFRSSAGARVKIQPSTYAAFDDVAAQLEGYARPLWVIAGLSKHNTKLTDFDVQGWLCAFEVGVDTSNDEYWGDLGDFDQRMVEMESISFLLLCSPEATLSLMSESTKVKLVAWLSQINNHVMPQNNWRWFRIFVNLALTQILFVPDDLVRAQMDADFAMLDSFYISEGWSSDGLWGDERKQADYYSGSFAIQFAQLLYVRLAKNDDERVERYREQARQFGKQYWRYFDFNGAAIPFGRSMTYRFAFAAFWAALAFAEVQLEAPLDDLGTVKGLLLRHLRWWSKHPDIFNTDGTLNIGFTYPNMYLSEDYNSPQSVYWCLKSFIVLNLPEEHPFWTCEEQPHPLAVHPPTSEDKGLPSIETIWQSKHIICSTPDHHFVLSSGQMTTKGHKAREAKYGKLAYSSSFAFSVPTGPLLHQMAPDSTISASHDGGETWMVRSNPYNVELTRATLGSLVEVPAWVSSWRPWNSLAIQVETTLIPLVNEFPGWHLRVHRVTWSGELQEQALVSRLELVDAGFAIPALTATGYHVPTLEQPGGLNTEGHFTGRASCSIRSQAGACGLLDLTKELNARMQSLEEEADDHVGSGSHGHLIRADPNTNLISQRTFIPSIKHIVGQARAQLSPQARESVAWFATAVFAVSTSIGGPELDIARMWSSRPYITKFIVDSGNSGNTSPRVVYHIDRGTT